MAENINDIIARTPSGGTAVLPSGEYEGPVYITKPLRLVGKNTTLWAKRGSIIEITARNAAIENLRVELTEGDASGCAITTQHPCEVNNVEVHGGVRGFGAEDMGLDMPRTIALGEFAADKQNTFVMMINVPSDTDIECGVSNISFSPKHLTAGSNTLTISVSNISAQTFLYAEVLFRSKFVRRVYISGRPVAGIDAVTDKVLYSAVPVSQQINSTPAFVEPSPVTDVITVNTPVPIYDMPVFDMRKGQRVSLYQYIGNRCEIHFTCDKPQGMDIDAYAFLLDSNEKAYGDKSLVFFGNDCSEKGEVKMFSDGHLDIDLEKADYRLNRIVIAYSVYAGNQSKNFSQVRAPKITVTSGGSERITYNLYGLNEEITVVAVEIYLYKNEWKISAVGSGIRDGMVKLCNRYGIEVTD